MNQKQNRMAVYALVCAALPPVPSMLSDPRALVKVQRKVRRATENALDMREKCKPVLEKANWAIFAGQFSDWTPPAPKVAARPCVVTAEQARELALGKTVHAVLGAAPVKRRIIDRVPAVLALESLRVVA